jgi:hypothetical protein
MTTPVPRPTPWSPPPFPAWWHRLAGLLLIWGLLPIFLLVSLVQSLWR